MDTGAEYMGWSVLEGNRQHDSDPVWDLKYVDSGVLGLHREDDNPWQNYRLDLIRYWTIETDDLLFKYRPTHFANETMPIISSGKGSAQSVLANAAIATVQALMIIEGIPITQVAAVSVKARIGGGKSATKPKVRDGVISLLPELAPRKSSWTKRMDESDAIGVGLVALGCRVAR
jgi:Holliday junction resolvasome RuvABC endonuclease subunit